MAPRAAWRLESLGFRKVYIYAGGKLDWMAAGLPTEGKNAGRPRAGDIARKDVPTARLGDRLGAVRERVKASGWDSVVVTNDDGIVLGLLRGEELAADGDLSMERAMGSGPSTFRPYVSAREMADYMTEHELESSPITTSDGRLVGLLLKQDAIAAAKDSSA